MYAQALQQHLKVCCTVVWRGARSNACAPSPCTSSTAGTHILALQQRCSTPVLHMQNGPAYCEAFLTVLRNVTKEEAVQYMLALIDDMLAGESFGSAMPAHVRLGSSLPCHLIASWQYMDCRCHRRCLCMQCWVCLKVCLGSA